MGLVIRSQHYQQLQSQIQTTRATKEAVIDQISTHGSCRYNRFVPELKVPRIKTHEKCQRYSSMKLDDYCDPQEFEISQKHQLKQIFAPFLTIIDGGIVKIGSNVKLGPRVTFITTTHPLDTVKRVDEEYEWARGINIGDFVRIGANVTILAGVSIGDNVVIGENSVVMRNVPNNAVFSGIPARMVKKDGNL
ncbi:unnamed protein product [Wickerhamomyces anomalus]